MDKELQKLYLKVNSYTRPADLLHLCYSKFMLIKTKCDCEIYDTATEILRDI